MRYRILALSALLSLIVHAWPIAYLVSQNFTEKRPKNNQQKTEPALLDFADSASTLMPNTVSRGLPSKDKDRAMSDILSGGFQKQTLTKFLTDDSVESVNAQVANQQNTADSGFPTDPMQAVQTSGHGWSGAVQFGNAMSLPFTLESLPFFRALYDRVDGMLIYPDDFAKQHITGSVRIEAELGKDGRLIRFISSTSDDRILQAYCFAALMQILSQPLPRGAWLETERAIVAFDFDFYIRITAQAPRTFHRVMQKNRLGFARENEIEPWLNEKIREIYTHYIPPIVPLPGGFYIDLILAYQYVNNLIEGTPPESQQRKARIEKLHDQLRETIRRPQPTPNPDPIESV